MADKRSAFPPGSVLSRGTGVGKIPLTKRRESKMKMPRTGAAGIALALLFVPGVISMSEAKTFVYVSNAQDGNIDAFVMDAGSGALTPIGKTEAASWSCR